MTALRAANSVNNFNVPAYPSTAKLRCARQCMVRHLLGAFKRAATVIASPGLGGERNVIMWISARPHIRSMRRASFKASTYVVELDANHSFSTVRPGLNFHFVWLQAFKPEPHPGSTAAAPSAGAAGYVSARSVHKPTPKPKPNKSVHLTKDT